MATDTEQLVVLLEARIKDFERNMAKASGTANREFGAIERRAELSAKKMEGVFGNLGSGLKGALGSFAPGFLASGLTGLISAETVQMLGSAVKSVADLADQAQRVSLPVEDFQALSYAAQQSGLETAQLGDLMEKFSRSIGEAHTKGGDLKKILDANGVSLTDANGQLRDTHDLFLAVVDLISRASTDQEALVIAATAIGRGAADALPFLRQGAQAIRESEDAARKAGAVIDKDLVQTAADFDDKWTAVWDTWTAKGKSAILEVMRGMEELLSKLDSGVFQKIDAFLAARGVTRDDLRANGSGLPGLSDGELDALGTILPSLSQEGSRLTQISNLEQQRNILLSKRADIEGQIHQLVTDGRPQIELDEYGDRLSAVLKQLADVEASLSRIRQLNAGPGPAWEMHGRGPAALSSTAPTTIPGSATAAGEEFGKAAAHGMLSLISAAEGTSGPNGYNVSLGNGAFTGGEHNLVLMTLDQIDALQSQMLANPANTFNSSALGKYQITQTTLRGLREQLGLTGDMMFDPQLQDQLAEALLARRGQDPNALRQEWQGLQKVDDATINQALGQSSTEMQRGNELINTRKTALDQLMTTQQRENQSLQVEAQAMGKSTFEAAKMRKENELLNQAKQAGIPLTAETRASISQLATEYARGAQAIDDMRTRQQAAAKSAAELKAAQQKAAEQSAQFNQMFSGAVKGFLSDLMNGTKAVDALRNALSNLAQQLMNMAVDQLFSGLGGKGGKSGGKMGMAGGLFHFSKGGLVHAPALRRYAGGGHVSGPGTGISDSIPAMLSNGEFVVTAAATAKHRALLEAINSGKLSAFAQGGLVGAPTLANAPAAGNVSVVNNVSVSATGSSDPKVQDDLARRISRELEASMRGVVMKEIMAQRRPGGALR